MKTKILFLNSEELIFYCIANSLQKKIDGEFYCIVESHQGVKDFMDNQNFVKFLKIWHLYDNIKTEKNVDIDYLRKFEDKYGESIWNFAYSERLFYPMYNKFHKFSDNEILSIIEQQCKFFESVLDEIKPDFLLIGLITRLPVYIIYKICQKKKIKVLTLDSAAFASRFTWTSKINEVENPENYLKIKHKSRSPEELRDYIKHHTSYASPYGGSSIGENSKSSKLKKLKAFVEFIFRPISEDYTTRYIHRGITKSKLLSYGTRFLLSLKRRRRENFLEKHTIHDVKNDDVFVYYPLHYEPERSLLMLAPFFTNQLSIIQNIARSLPVEYKLYVKDHPRMRETGWRKIHFYQSILDIPNVKLVSPKIKSSEILEQCSLVATLGGTTGLEASYYGKPSVVMGNADYSVLPWIHNVDNIKDLPSIIRTALNSKVDIEHLDAYTEYVEQNSFKFEKVSYWYQFSESFPYMGFLQKLDISPKKMDKFLKDTAPIFENISDEFIKKINKLSVQYE